MDCDLMADDANAARDFLIDLWPYARPARFLSSKVDSLFLFFTRVSDFGLSINNPLVFCHVVIPSITVEIPQSGFYQSLLTDVMQVAGLQQLMILSTSGHPAAVIAGRKVQAESWCELGHLLGTDH